MTTPTTLTSGQSLSLLETLKDESILLLAGPLAQFSTAMELNPSALGAAGAWIQLQGNLINIIPKAEVQLIQQLNAVILSKIAALVTKAQAELGVTPPTSTVAPVA